MTANTPREGGWGSVKATLSDRLAAGRNDPSHIDHNADGIADHLAGKAKPKMPKKVRNPGSVASSVADARPPPPLATPTMGEINLETKSVSIKSPGDPPLKPFTTAPSNPTDRNGDRTIEYDPFAVLLVHDALERETSYYYIDEGDNNAVKSIWATDENSRKWALSFRNPTFSNALFSMAFFDIIVSFISQSGTMPGIVSIAQQLTVFITFIYIAAVVMRLYFIWSARKDWFSGASEGPWIVIHAFVILCLRTSTFIIVHFTGKQSLPLSPSLSPSVQTPSADLPPSPLDLDGKLYASEGSWPNIHCDNPYVTVIDSIIKAWCFIYFNSRIRTMVIAFLKVISGLGPLYIMICCSFLGHFFIIQAFAQTCNDVQNGFGVLGWNSPDGTANLTPNVWDALYNLFGLMTTVNHPVINAF